MRYALNGQNYCVEIEAGAHSACIAGGYFGGLQLRESPLTALALEHISTGEEREVTSLSHWERVTCQQFGSLLRLNLCSPEGLGDVMVVLTAHADEEGIDWQTEILNASEEWSVAQADYPAAQVGAEAFDLFLPDDSGRCLKHAGQTERDTDYAYPHIRAAMQYFAFWNEQGGLYLGVHDPDGCIKKFRLRTGADEGRLDTSFPAIGAGRAQNSFSLGGTMRWQFFTGDWYDSTMIYADFVWHHAKWLPYIDENGRPDTPEKYKNIPFWVVDYILNSPAQGDARPMTLGTVSQKYGPDYWFEATVQLQKRLGVPIAYHVYNWHEIPFNIGYPHYTPAKAEYFRGLSELRKADILIFPYINAVSWEENDADEGFPVNFTNTGRKGAVIDKNGQPVRTQYPQKKADGSFTQLMPICPGFAPWHDIIEKEVREIERTMDVDGVYFDEIAAHRAHPCRSEAHGHIPGGGSHWSEGYNRLMDRVRAGKPENSFYFTECNGEPYMKSFNGYLTWLWQSGDGVPAFPAIYAGYIQMIGRSTDGKYREDDLYFRYHLAVSLLYGQQLGWINAAVIYHEERMAFLEKMVRARCEHTAMFNSGRLLRPPVIHSGLQPVTSSEITMEMVQAGAWRRRKGSETLIMAVNVAREAAECEMSFSLNEYGLTAAQLPEGFTAQDDRATGKFTLAPCDIRIWRMDGGEEE